MSRASKGTWRVDPAYLGLPFEGRTALLSPLDRLVFDRKRLLEIFDFDYQLEMYKPAAKRRWGYWAMPILYGDRLVGKLDATADRKAGVLRVDAIHQDVAFDKDDDRRRRPRDRRPGRGGSTSNESTPLRIGEKRRGSWRRRQPVLTDSRHRIGRCSVN